MIATEQAFYSLVAARRAGEGKNSFYRMDDVTKVVDPKEGAVKAGEGLEGEHHDVKAHPMIYFGKAFNPGGVITKEEAAVMVAQMIFNMLGRANLL